MVFKSSPYMAVEYTPAVCRIIDKFEGVWTMAYVPQYRYDVFISYAHRDEKPAPGWVSAFKAKLEAELGQELGEDPEIWFDLERLKEGFVLQETIRYDLSRTALFLRLESPSCLQSPYCPKELEWFRNPQLPLDPLEIEHRSRVIPLVIRVQCHVHDPNVIEGAFHDKDGLPLDSEGLEIRGHDGGVESIAFAPLGNRLAAGLNDGAVNMFDLRRPNVSPQVFPGDQSTVYSVSIAPDGDYLAASGDGTVRVWDLDKPKNRPRILSGHQGPVFSVACAPDGDRLASAGDDKDIRIWDLHQPNAPPDTLSGHQDVVWFGGVRFGRQPPRFGLRGRHGALMAAVVRCRR